MNTEQLTSKVSKTFKDAKAGVPRDKRLAAALRTLKHEIVIIGRPSRDGEPVIFEISEFGKNTTQLEHLLLDAYRRLLE